MKRIMKLGAGETVPILVEARIREVEEEIAKIKKAVSDLQELAYEAENKMHRLYDEADLY